MKKRFLSILLTACMSLSLLPMTAVGKAVTATRNPAQFVVDGRQLSVPATYNIGSFNYLSLRGIAVLLNGTAAQFDVGWDGAYAAIETGKPYTGERFRRDSPKRLTPVTPVKVFSFILTANYMAI